jgi:hypothetical protein
LDPARQSRTESNEAVRRSWAKSSKVESDGRKKEEASAVRIRWAGRVRPGGGDALKVPFETLNVLKGTFETSPMS